MPHVDIPQASVRAGVARGDITPPVGIYHRMWGAAVHDQATGVHRSLTATVLWLAPSANDASQPADAQLIVALDHCILDRAEIQLIRTAVSTATGIAGEKVQVSLSHTHGAGFMSRSRARLPGGELIGPYLDSLAEEVALLAVEAKEHLAEATIVYGMGRCGLAVQRDFYDEVAGHFVCGFNPAGVADDTLLVARIATSSGTLATLVNYACHPTTLAWDNTAISPDWVGSMRDTIETATRAPCLFLQGASGDLGPRYGYVGDHEAADRNGRQVAYSALGALESLPPAGMQFEYAGPTLSGCWIGVWKFVSTSRPLASWQWEQLTVDLPYRQDLPTMEHTLAERSRWQLEEDLARSQGNDSRVRECRANVEQMTRQLGRLESLPPGSAYPLTVVIGRVGDGLWVFCPGELYQLFQTKLRERIPHRPMVVATITNDWQPGYLPAESSYGKGIYQDIISPLAPGCLEKLIDAVSEGMAVLDRR